MDRNMSVPTSNSSQVSLFLLVLLGVTSLLFIVYMYVDYLRTQSLIYDIMFDKPVQIDYSKHYQCRLFILQFSYLLFVVIWITQFYHKTCYWCLLFYFITCAKRVLMGLLKLLNLFFHHLMIHHPSHWQLQMKDWYIQLQPKLLNRLVSEPWTWCLL